MSNRSLIEVNHDYSYRIERDAEGFVKALGRYLGSASPKNAEQLERYGIRVFGMRHHSDGYSIDWGGHLHSESS